MTGTKRRSRYGMLAALSPVGLFYTDAEGNCRYVNRQCCRLVGRPARQLKGRGWVEVLHPADAPRVIEQWNRAVPNGEPFQCEHRLNRTDGRTVWVLAQAVPERTEGGAVLGFVGTLTDISRQK